MSQQQPPRSRGDDELDMLRSADAAAGSPQCQGCGCTNNYACIGGCHWVRWGLCSRCTKNGSRFAI